jgi:hypothetical protein
MGDEKEQPNPLEKYRGITRRDSLGAAKSMAEGELGTGNQRSTNKYGMAPEPRKGKEDAELDRRTDV